MQFINSHYYGKDNLKDTITKKNRELDKMIELWEKQEAKRESIVAEAIPFEENFAHEYDEHQRLIKELREYENFLY